jgi:GNAT superfamily N-acetyltransferase
MLIIQPVDLSQKNQVQKFIEFPFRIYRDDPVWVPPLWVDMSMQLSPRKNPFFEHSTAEFFLAIQDGQVVGRIAALENRHFNQYHGFKKAQFYDFECVEDISVASALFERVFDWARKRGLDSLIGPKGFGVMDGYGMLISGFDQRCMMTSMNHNPAYYPTFMEQLGFSKEVDFISTLININDYQVPERVQRIASWVEQHRGIKIHQFRTIKELKAWSWRIGETYNNAFVHNWEFAPLTNREIKMVVDTLELVADPHLIKIITHDDNVIGFALAFPDVGKALQRHKGHLSPIAIADLFLEMRRTDWVAINGGGILPEFQGLGGNALLYAMGDKMIRTGQFSHAAFYQVAETAVQMRKDLDNLGAIPYKNHRVYKHAL